MVPTNDARSRTNNYLAVGVCGFLFVAVSLIYGQTLDHVLLDYDDNYFVFRNPHVTPGLTAQGMWWAWTDGPFGEWYPLAMLSHMLDCQIFGLEAWGHHLHNLLLHAATSIALFLVLWRMTDELWPTAFVAAVFAVHPQHVESVAWVAERKDVLSGLFFVLTLGAWLGYVRHGRSPGWYALVAALFVLGLLAKPMVVTVPPLLLLLDFWPLARCGSPIDAPRWTASIERPGMRRLLLEKLPLLALTAADCLITLRTHLSGEEHLASSVRLGNAAVSCVSYVAQFFYPVDLAAFYPIAREGLPAWQVAGAIAILSTVSTAVVIGRRRCPYCFVGWFWYLGLLAPVLGVVKIGWLAMADRYMYLPSIGLSIALAWSGARLAAGSTARRWALAAGATLSIGLLMAVAARQTSYWSDDETLWRHALAVATANSKAELALAKELGRQGRIDEAIAYCRRAAQHSIDAAPFNDLGVLLLKQGQLEAAIAQFRAGLAIEPRSHLGHFNLGTALAAQDHLDEATQHFRRAIEIDPSGTNAYIGLAHLLLSHGKTDDARIELERALTVDPNNCAIRNDLGSMLLQEGRIDESIQQYEAALATDPNFVLTYVNLGYALAASGQFEQALAHFRRALELDPSNTSARAKLDKLLRRTGQPAPGTQPSVAE